MRCMREGEHVNMLYVDKLSNMWGDYTNMFYVGGGHEENVRAAQDSR
jgi:hypothetical protein